MCKLNYIIEQMNSTDICKTFHANPEECTTFAFHVTFSKMDHVLGHKTIIKFGELETSLKFY